MRARIDEHYLHPESWYPAISVANLKWDIISGRSSIELRFQNRPLIIRIANQCADLLQMKPSISVTSPTRSFTPLANTFGKSRLYLLFRAARNTLREMHVFNKNQWGKVSARLSILIRFNCRLVMIKRMMTIENNKRSIHIISMLPYLLLKNFQLDQHCLTPLLPYLSSLWSCWKIKYCRDYDNETLRTPWTIV